MAAARFRPGSPMCSRAELHVQSGTPEQVATMSKNNPSGKANSWRSDASSASYHGNSG